MTLLAGWLDAAWCLAVLALAVGVIWGLNVVISEVERHNKGGRK